MAALEHAHTGVRHPLASRTLVGRSRACELRLASNQVSSVHAEVQPSQPSPRPSEPQLRPPTSPLSHCSLGST